MIAPICFLVVSRSCSLFYGPLYLHPQSIRTPMLCCPIGTNMFPEVCERMTKELTASVPSTMKIIVVPPPDGNIFAVGHCAEVLLQCKDSSTHPLHRKTPRVDYGPLYLGSHFLHSTRPAEPCPCFFNNEVDFEVLQFRDHKSPPDIR